MYIEGVKSGKGGKFITSKSLEKEIVAMYKRVVKFNGPEYTICYIRDKHVFDEAKLPPELVMKRVSYMPVLHLLFYKNTEK